MSGDQRVDLALSGTSDKGTDLTEISESFTITENDDPAMPRPVTDVTVTLEVSSLTVAEGSSETLSIRLTEATSEDVTVTLTVAGTAREGDDYELLPSAPFVLTPGMTELAVGISTVIDGLYEGDETLEFVISTLSGPAVTGAMDRVTVTIEDGDAVPTLSLEPLMDVEEGADLTLTVTLSGELDVAVEVTVSIAQLPSSVFPVVTIPARTRMFIFTIQIPDNDVYGGDQTVDLALSGTSDKGTDLTEISESFTITENDDPAMPRPVTDVTVTLEVSSLTVAEGSSETLSIRLTEATSEDVTVTLTVAGSTATEGADYELLPSAPFVLTPGMTELAVGISTVIDGLYEGDETLEFVISTLSGPAVTGAMDRVTVTIEDGDAVPTLSLEPLMDVEEGADLTLTVTLSGELDVAVEVTVSIAQLPSSVFPVVTIPARTRMFIFTIQIPDNNVYEGDQRVDLALSGTSDKGTDLTEISESFTIIENDVVIGFRPDAYEVDESAGVVTVTVEVISGVLTQDVTLSYTTVEDSATDPEDYIGGSGMPIPTLSALITSVTFRIMIEDDSTQETEEMFTVVLSGGSSGVILDPAIATVTIPANDQPTGPGPGPDPVVIGFEPVTYSVDENAGPVVLTVKLLSGTLTAPVTLSYATMNGSAIAPGDYTAVSMGTLTLTPGASEMTIMVPIIDDNTNEPEEMFTVTLSGASGGATLDPSVATVTINDDDPPPADPVVIGFEPVTYNVDENDGSVVLTVKLLSGTLTAPVTLSYATMNGSAIAPGDYTAVSMGTLTLTPGASEMTITVPIIDDPTQESEEEFTVVLSGASGGATLNPAIATVTIPTNDQRTGGGGGGPGPDPVVIGFERVTYSVNEDAGPVVLTVKLLSGTLTSPVTVSYAIDYGRCLLLLTWARRDDGTH